MRIRALCVSLALVAISGTAYAAPITYSFQLTVTELKAGGLDPYYTNFHLGQRFYGTLTYDPDSAVETLSGVYGGAAAVTMVIDGTTVTARYPGVYPRTYATMTNSAEGDTFYFFEEQPVVSGGYLGNFGAEQFWISLEDYEGLAITGTVPGPIDFTQFESGRWNFWSWGSDISNSPLKMYGTVSSIREVPTPPPLALAPFTLLALFGRKHPRSDAARRSKDPVRQNSAAVCGPTSVIGSLPGCQTCGVLTDI